MEILLSNGVVLSSSVGFELQAMVIEAAIVATKSVAWLVMMMGTMPNGIHVLIKEPEAYAGFPLALLAVRKPCLENKDAGDTEDDDEEEEENEDGGDEDEDTGEEEDGSGKDGEGEDGEDPEDEPEANGDEASGDEDDEDDDDDDEMTTMMEVKMKKRRKRKRTKKRKSFSHRLKSENELLFFISSR